ncbi:unnamed protein product [Meloidogyne enterolobii]|uniref:Uncharacterized protein n=2 Tax=Meloidogyne enterolobii TaxID=390850 RepID=A0ACB1B894_MELEN
MDGTLNLFVQISTSSLIATCSKRKFLSSLCVHSPAGELRSLSIIFSIRVEGSLALIVVTSRDASSFVLKLHSNCLQILSMLSQKVRSESAVSFVGGN